MTYEELTATVYEVEQLLQTPMKVYYIGNCGLDRRGKFDDRSWAIRFYEFEDAHRPQHHFAAHNLPLGKTAEWMQRTPIQLAMSLQSRHQYLIQAPRNLVRQLDLQDAMDRRNEYSVTPFIPREEVA